MIVQKAKTLIPHWMHHANVFYTTVTCVILANLLVLHFFYENYYARHLANASVKQHSHLAIGQALPQFSAESLDGSVVDSNSYRGKWVLAVYYGSRLNPNHLTHSQAMLEKYGNKDFQPLAVVNADAQEVRRIVAGDISYPIILDPDHAIANTLHLHGEETGTFLADPQGSVRFSVPDIPNQSDLRQLVERFVLNRNTAGAGVSSPGSLKAGGGIPEFKIKNVRAGTESGINELDLANAYMIFFGADCSACAISTYLDAIQNISLSGKANAKLYLVFSKNFSSYDLAERLNSKGLNLPVYVARNEIEALSPYEIKSVFGEEAILITTSTRGKIKSITALTKWLADINGGGK